ncbi:nitrate reductase [Oceanomicrobium pacificus]|uniref:Molybdopterin-dependent oxidoreductase n=1 Tax=Oceanomicrobium pacificus TaxID=2692916 RepID=A0A6B0TQ13_9RHOB|nr:nitrate reductase [Oceanomicrobium pacificus]MXU63885.1 molybdopterin-dependent oxidoreductase [Oceanomicrobium pacificus]
MSGPAGTGAPVRTTCAYCGVGCGVLATPEADGGTAIAGDPDHPANFGRLCSKGSALGATLGAEGRLLDPLIAGQRSSWVDATALVAARFADTIARHGPDSVAFYVSGQLLTEDYYVANKLMKGFIGSANIDTNSRLCMASSVAGHKRAFGSDTVPGCYEDLEEADLVVLVGSNLAWCHPVLHQRLMAARDKRGTRIVTIDPRRTVTADQSDLHLALRPGSDTSLFNGLLHHLADRGHLAAGAIDAVEGLADALALAASDAAAGLAERCGLSTGEIAAFFAEWAGTERVVTVYSQGVNQARNGTDKVNAILNCHLATGRIGRVGMGPFSVTGQPNAMGGREVGGLANMLACHLDLENAAHRAAVQDYWSCGPLPQSAGLKAVDLFDACASGQVRALWIMGTNPAVSLPRADHVRDAIAACDFTVVSDVTADTDTAELADVLLPAAGWGEKDGTVTNSERRISRQRAFCPAPGQARPDWQIICDVARAMGFGAGFDFGGPHAIFAEYAGMTALSRRFGRDLDLTGLAGLDRAGYDALRPVQWPVAPGGAGTDRMFGDGDYFTPSGRPRAVAVAAGPELEPQGGALLLNTGRIRDQWHTMTRSGQAEVLTRHIAEPFLEIHPEDAARRGIGPADIVTVSGQGSTATLRALVTSRVRPGTLFAPMHWSGQFAADARVDALVAPDRDPVSGQPALKSAPVHLSKCAWSFYGFALGAGLVAPDTPYWARAALAGGAQMEFAAPEAPADMAAFFRRLAGLPAGADLIEVEDRSGGGYRAVCRKDGRVVAAIFTAAEPVPVSRAWLRDAYGDTGPADLLAGRPGADRPDPGPTVCACFGVGMNTIRQAIAEQGLSSVDEIGAALQAGTNCGSCKPELDALLARSTARLAAE